MHPSTLLAVAGIAAAKTITVTLTSDNKFSPDNVTASTGDVLEFQFGPSNHSVVMGTFNSVNGACTPANSGGFWSGFVAVSSGLADKAFKVTLNNTDPLVFYSSKDKQCPDGMIGVVNPSGNSTLETYVKEASKLSAGVSPSGSAYGGVFGDRDSSSSSSSSSSASSGSSASSTSSSSSASSSADSKSAAAVTSFSTLAIVAGSLMALAL